MLSDMSAKIFRTEFDDNKEIYGSGETVSGQLVFVSDESLNIDSVQVIFSGKAYVSWKEGRGKKKREHIGEQLLFLQNVRLSGSQKTLPSGRSTFPFSFELPQELPTSIEVPGSYVRYSVEGLVKRPGLHENLTTEAIFTVFDIVDLNQAPLTQFQLSLSDSKNLCCWCCSSGPIEVKVTVDKTGYVLGEPIKVTGSILNLSKSDIRDSDYSIVQVMTMHARSGKSRVFPVELVKAQGLSCKRRTGVKLTQFLQMPIVPPTYRGSCGILNIEYFLQFSVYTGALHFNLRIQVPLVIGVIPFGFNRAGQPATASVTVNTAETSFQPLAILPIASASTERPISPSSSAEAASVDIPQEKDDNVPTN